MTVGPLTTTSPSSIRTSRPGSGSPTVPALRRPGRFDGHDRAAFGQAIAFMHGDAELPGTCGKRLRDAVRRRRRRSAGFRGKHALGFELGNEPARSMRHQHGRRRLPAFERATHVSGAAGRRDYGRGADAKCVRAPTRIGTQMAVMVSSSKESGKTDR